MKGNGGKFPKNRVYKGKQAEKQQQKTETKTKTGKKPRAEVYQPLPSVKDFRVSVESKEQLSAVLSVEAVSLIYLDEACFSDEELPNRIREIHEKGKKAGLRLRRIERKENGVRSCETLLTALLSASSPAGVPDVVMARCMEEMMVLLEKREQLQQKEKQRGTGSAPSAAFFPEIVFDYTIYGYNHEATETLAELGADRLTLPIELNKRELQALRSILRNQNMPAELLVYGHLPMMVSANCIQKTTRGCDKKNRTEKLIDRMGKAMPVRMYCKYCYNQIFNAEPYSIAELGEEILALAPDSIRYDFSIESGEKVKKILAGMVPDGLTRGHFRHGVE